MKTSFLDTRLDRQWLRETALKASNLPAGYALPLWRSAMIHGNEDCPQMIELYADEAPDVFTAPAVILALNDAGTYDVRPAKS